MAGLAAKLRIQPATVKAAAMWGVAAGTGGLYLIQNGSNLIRPASKAGVIRDENGCWVCGSGFAAPRIENVLAIEAEVEAILEGLQLAWDKYPKAVILESDSKAPSEPSPRHWEDLKD
ncbi:hypothetical protein PIB30_061182 [Stylosanthes scabra]|uniref:RNase H type-1 domain-containing protein n=1 Tax=Stylosanthes scabra TaxID=79078 RepID=A0ABU6SKW9_9FABA|nr:hypothetical protein [Stylosanthes scabra]